MDVTVESTAGLERRMRVEIPEDRISGEIASRLQSMSRTVRVPGFRPGKVPLKLVRSRFGPQVREEVMSELVRSSFYDALVQEKLRPAGAPTFEPLETGPGSGLAYTAVFEVFPEVSVANVEGLTVIRPVAEVRDEDVDTMLETLRVRRKTWEDVDRAATAEDRVVVDFEGLLEGESFEGGTGSEVPVELDGGRMIAGFEEGLLGATAGEERTLELQFPDDYHHQPLAGRPATFKVTVRSVQRSVLPEIDEELARSLGVEDGSVETLRRDVRENMERELEDALRARRKQEVMDALLKAHPVELPVAMVEEEKARLLQQQGDTFRRHGINAEDVGLQSEQFEEPARRRVALGLLLAEVVQSSRLTAAPDRVRGRIEKIASSYEDPSSVVSWFYGDKSRLAEVESSVLEEQVIEWICERADVRDQQASFDELLKPGQTTADNVDAPISLPDD